MNQQFDVIVVGGGMVGAAFACALLATDLRIAIVDHHPLGAAWNEDERALRVCSLNRASRQFLDNLDVWSTMCDMRVSPFTKMHVWDYMGKGYIDFDSDSVGYAELGHIVENDVTQHALLSKLSQAKQVTLLPSTELHSLRFTKDKAEVQTKQGDIFTASLVVGADGARSWVREQAHLPMTSWEYDQSAVITRIKTEYPHGKTAWQRFLPSGPLAFLPMEDPHESAVVWSTSPEEAERLMALDAELFCKALGLAFEFKLGAVSHAVSPLSFPLQMRHVKHYVKPQLALIGDAAHTIHPLAGQGANLGLMDAATLADVLQQGLARNEPLGSYELLRRYERWRKGQTLAMIATMEAFKRLFSNSHPALVWLRNSGLQITDRLSFIKPCILRQAMGLSSDLPRSAKMRWD